MTDWNAVSAFMAAVVPWPSSPQDDGWVVMPNGYPDKKTTTGRLPTGKYPIGNGRAFKTVDEFVNFAGWAIQQHFYKDLFYCLSLQRDVTTSRSGKPKGKRTVQGAISLKAIWLDVDVGKLDKEGNPVGYQTVQEALKAVIDFQQRNKLPSPSAIVGSGGGIHIYWISDVALTPEEWRPYAEGLKALAAQDGLVCDLGVTTDAARILRVPGTFNHKEATPRPCQLFNVPLVMYDFPTQLTHLTQITPLSPVTKSEANLMFDPALFRGMTPVLKADPNDKLEAGIDKYGDMPIDPRPVFKDCGFYRTALANGGADLGQQLWMYSVLGATFMENGRGISHKISKGHATYTPADTDAMFDRKLADRTDRGIGYPSCSAIAGAGCKACHTCPLLAKGKSPLNIRPAVAATSSSSSSSEQGQGSTSEITVNYFPGNEVACSTALDNVVAADLSTFTSGDILTILRVPDQEKPGLERWGGDLPGTTPALPADIIERAERLKWMAPSGGKASSRDKSEDKGDQQRWKRCKPPRDFCTDYITQRRGRYAARLLGGIARVPFIRDDGTIRVEPGYDPETGIFVDRAPNLVVPDFPTLDDAKAALARVMKPFEHYKFEDPEHGPLLVLAANLTALQRPYMKTAPMFVVNGVQAGTGKGQLCRAIGHLALATTPPFMSWGHDDDEFKKRFDTMLLASPAMLVMDNCNARVLRGDTLEMILSEGEATIRQFNKLEAITVRSRTFLMANGNNIQISGDMSRRGIKINILPRSASPESDMFPFTPEDYVIKNRDALLSDYYTIMRAYRHAGMPRTGLPAVGSFSEWERKVRDLIFWLTGHDLSGDFKKNKLDDPEQQEDAAVLSALRALCGERWFKASEVDAALKRTTERRRDRMYITGQVTSIPGRIVPPNGRHARAAG
jgi:hypothetical protein